MRLEKAAEKYGLMESQIKQVLKVYPQAHPEEIAEMLAYFGA
ncbi:MAG: hypothetical protein RR272_02905 [Synergistaceae bacterium]